MNAGRWMASGRGAYGMLLGLILMVCVSNAWASAWDEAAILGMEQPDVVSRRALDAPFVYVYTAPNTDTDPRLQHWTDLVERAYRDALSLDARVVWSGVRPAHLYAAAKKNPSSEERAIERELEIGYRLYRMGELQEATRTLHSALMAVEGTGVAWVNEALVVDAWQTLARAYQERLSSSSSAPSELASNVRLALQQWIRMRPQERLEEYRYPRAFVEAWRQVYFEQLSSSAAVLSMRKKEARYIAATLDVDVVPDVRIAQSGTTGTIAVRVYDAQSDRFAYDAILPWNGQDDDLSSTLSEAFSVAQECLRLMRKETEGRQRRLHSNYLSIESLLFFYAERPTSRAFLNSGIRLGGHHYVTPAIGFFADVSVSFSRRDRAGELLKTVQTQSLSAGASFQYERPRFRVFVDAGLEFSRRTELVVTSSFWCRVSGGEPTEYDDAHACRSSDVFSQRASALLGVRLGAGLSVRVAGPLWWQMTLTSTMYLVPFGHRGVDRPIGGTVGLVYGF